MTEKSLTEKEWQKKYDRKSMTEKKIQKKV